MSHYEDRDNPTSLGKDNTEGRGFGGGGVLNGDGSTVVS